ncbi:hypothetical protein FJ251_08445 [bacterium]|nr:hypothetical protein [bacterium]
MLRGLCGLALALALLLLASSPCAAEAIWVELGEDGLVDVWHIDVEYNCCWLIAADTQTAGGVVDLFELRGPGSEDCICMCEFDLHFSFAAPPPGEYLLRVWYAVYPGEEPPLAAELPLVIPAAGAGPVLVDQSPCGGWATGVPDPPRWLENPSFSAIRAHY